MSDLPQLDALGTIVTPVHIDASRLELRADYFGSSIDLDLLQSRYSRSPILRGYPETRLALNSQFVA